MLTCRDVVISQGSFELRVNVGFDAPVTALLGPSGAGKSTLLNAIAGFVPLTRGDISWDGGSLAGLSPGARPVSMLFQDNNLFPHLTVRDNLALAITQGRINASHDAQITKALAWVELPGVEGRKPAALSGGQQSRVALARALLQNRPVLLLDEPFAALGPALKHDMLDLVAQICTARGVQVIMVSHDPEDARRIATDACVVADGAVSQPAETGALLANPPPALAQYLGRS
ncbi:thiamine ABC transporter ATP-binding protein [Roseobacteraceae bacterium S113]